VKKLIMAVALLCACHSSPPPSTSVQPVLSGNQTGAPDGIAAIRTFLAAAKQQDLQAMGAIWGTAKGPARDQMDRAYMEKAELIMACYLKHDRYEIAGDAPNPGGTRAVVVNLSLGDLKRATTFQVVQGPARRWYVQDVDVKALQEFCARRS
jgi:hypothetical protein